MVSLYWNFTSTQAREDRQETVALGGIHSAGSWSPFSWLRLSVTAHSCACLRSLAKPARWSCVHWLAPDRHASASGTMWSMSTSAGSFQVAPSYGLVQLPEV